MQMRKNRSRQRVLHAPKALRIKGDDDTNGDDGMNKDETYRPELWTCDVVKNIMKEDCLQITEDAKAAKRKRIHEAALELAIYIRFLGLDKEYTQVDALCDELERALDS